MNTFALPQPEGTLDNSAFELIPRVINVLFKWKWLILTCFVAIVVPVLIVTFLKDPQYQVATKIIVKSSRAELAVSSGGPERFVNWPITPAVINSEIQILKSLDLIQTAVEKSAYPLLVNGENDSPAQRERALQSLRTRINVTPVPDSNIIEASFQDRDAGVAARFLNTLVALYLQRHGTVHRGNNDAAEFFTQQAVLYKTRLEKAKEALEQYQGKDKIIDVNQEITLNLAKVSKSEETLKDIQAEIEGAEKEIGTLEQQVKQQPDQIPTQKTVMVNPEVTSLTVKIIELEKQRNELLQRYTAKSRFVIDKENEIAALRKQLEGTQQHVAGDTVISQNRVRETLNQQLMQKKAALDSLKAKRRSLLQEMAPHQARLNVLKNRSLDSERLQQEFNSTRDTYLLYMKKSEESRISTAMDENKLINVGVVQDAIAPVLSVGRGLMLAGALAAVSGLALGVAIAFALEFFNLTIKSEDDVERFLGVPVLATIRQF